MSSKTAKASMKQATLGFASKRVGSKAIIGKEKKGIVRAKFAPVARTKSPREVEEISDSEEEEEDDIVPIEIEEIQPDKDEEPLKKKKEIKKRRSLSLSPPKEDSAVANDKASQLKQEAEPDVPRADLDVHDPKWREPYARARERMGRVSPIHAEKQNKLHEILRVFDLSYEYGPCIGMTRLRRWERAEALGLHPPPEVRDILTTKQGVEQVEYALDVFGQEAL